MTEVANLSFYSGGESGGNDESSGPELPDWEGLTRKQVLDKLLEHEMPECISDYDT